eukprot:TRINITY_DN10665_c0_g1_i1.p1 TRINITY_DN10665_c0_g1~~TRINITY_DN10665_c0_g1_i1.p1  ORF type:complete len:203 (-),score=48.93 TRINITY_DN10665_c0_g1_i1:199-807(-)
MGASLLALPWLGKTTLTLELVLSMKIIVVLSELCCTISLKLILPLSKGNKMQPAVKKIKMATEILKVKRLSEHAKLPVRGSARAAGYDLFSAEATKVPSRGKALVKTDISIAVPSGCYGRIAPRSSLAWKNHVDVGAGVIDEDYRGPVGVVLYNFSEVDFAIEQGDRIAQLIIERIATPDVEEVDDLDGTDRGAGGFGSTGK